jgi:hypothetical protein
MISHSDVAKPAAKSGPSRAAGAAKAQSISTFIFLDLFRRASNGEALHRRVFLIFRTGKLLKRDLRLSRGASIAGLRELEASALSATYTLAAILFTWGQLLNESASELAQPLKDRELQAGLKNNEFNRSSVSLDETSTMPALGFITIKCHEEACIGSNSCEPSTRQPKLTKSPKCEYITGCSKHMPNSHLLSSFVSIIKTSGTSKITGFRVFLCRDLGNSSIDCSCHIDNKNSLDGSLNVYILTCSRSLKQIHNKGKKAETN